MTSDAPTPLTTPLPTSFHLSTLAASAFAEREVVPAVAELMDKAHALTLTTGQFIEALINVHAETLASLMGPKAAGDLLQDLGRHLTQRSQG